MALVKATGLRSFSSVLLGLSVKVVFRLVGQEQSHLGCGQCICCRLDFQELRPASLDRRHLITAFPPSLMLMMAGATWITRRVPDAWPMLTKELLICVGLLAIFAVETFAIPRKASYGFEPRRA